jgi:hypothetical protein
MNEAEWLAPDGPRPILEYLRGKTSDRKLRLFACACCRRIWHLLTEASSRVAVEVAEFFADGKVTSKELAAAWAAASDAASDAARAAASDAAWAAARAAASDAAWAAAWAAARAAARAAASDAERKNQAALLRDVFGNPWRHYYGPDCGPVIRPGGETVTFLERGILAWQGGTVPAVAQAAYDQRLSNGTLDQTRLFVLADALEEAGCEDETLLCHLRGWEKCHNCIVTPGRYGGGVARVHDCRDCNNARWLRLRAPHVRGCWAVDLLVGKE